MAKLRDTRKRNKAIVTILLPVIIFLWIIGWSLYWISFQEQPRKSRSKSTLQEDQMSMKPIILEEPAEA